MSNTNGSRRTVGTHFGPYRTPSHRATKYRAPPQGSALRALLTEASEHCRRGDHALAIYLETLAAVALRTAEIQGVPHG